MEIEKSEITNSLNTRDSGNVKIGNYIRVKVLNSLGKGRFLVEFKGKGYSASWKGNITSKLFIAKVIKIAPQLELKFIKGLDNKKPFFNSGVLDTLLNIKKSFIQNLITSDNFFINLSVLFQKDKKGMRENIQTSINKQNILNVINKNAAILNEVKEYYVLQNIYNYINPNSYIFYFPFKIYQKNYFCDLRLFGGKESLNNSLFLSISLDNERKLWFFVFIDYEVIVCTVSANDMHLERRLKLHINALVKNLQNLNYNRKVEIHFAPYSEQDYLKLNMIKKINIKM